MSGLRTDIYICEGSYDDVTGLYADSVKKACSCAVLSDGISGTLNVSFVSEEEIQRLNRSFRNTDSVTDVLSFPANILECPIKNSGLTCDMQIEDDMVVLGDIAVCFKRAAEQADEYGHSLERELCFLCVHGTLHLMGYDHIDADGEKEMFDKQEKVLSECGILR